MQAERLHHKDLIRLFLCGLFLRRFLSTRHSLVDGICRLLVAGAEQFAQPLLQGRPAKVLADNLQMVVQEICLRDAVNAIEQGDRVLPTLPVEDVRIAELGLIGGVDGLRVVRIESALR